jgi:ribosomal protein S18 acetylase RimI-like enzyme
VFLSFHSVISAVKLFFPSSCPLILNKKGFMSREIRKAQANDAPFLHEICSLVLQSRPDLRGKAETELTAMAHWEITLRANPAFVAWENGERAGAVWLYGENEAVKRYFTLRGIGVLPAHQKRGIGTALLQHALEYCRQQMASVVTLEVAPDNVAAISLYRKSGFELTTLIMQHKFE